MRRGLPNVRGRWPIRRGFPNSLYGHSADRARWPLYVEADQFDVSFVGNVYRVLCARHTRFFEAWWVFNRELDRKFARAGFGVWIWSDLMFVRAGGYEVTWCLAGPDLMLGYEATWRLTGPDLVLGYGATWCLAGPDLMFEYEAIWCSIGLAPVLEYEAIGSWVEIENSIVQIDSVIQSQDHS